MFSTLVPLFIIISTFLANTKADNEFCGCQSILPSAYITLSPPAGQSSFTSSDQCWQGCYAATNPTPAVAGRSNYRHSTWQQSTGTCTCTDRYPFGSAQRVGNQQSKTCATPSDWYNTIVQTTFVKYPSCYTAAPSGLTMTSITGPDSCSYRCGTSLQMVFYMSSTDGGYQCGCGRISTFPPTSSQCGPNVFWIYYHTEAQASQGLSRRAHREEAKRKFSKKTLCPKGFSACRVGDGSDAFECIDTQRDIDSCGGCMHGSFDDPMSRPGEICQTPGVVMGYSTCDKGRCVASKCKPGHVLVNEQCIKRAHIPGRRTASDSH